VIRASANNQAQSLSNKFNVEIHGTQLVIQVTKMWWDLETKLVEVEAQLGHRIGGKTVSSAIRVKLPRLDGPISWVVFLCQFNLVAERKNWTDHYHHSGSSC
jgi:hypothetical protein